MTLLNNYWEPGSLNWVEQIIERMGLESTLRPKGRLVKNRKGV